MRRSTLALVVAVTAGCPSAKPECAADTACGGNQVCKDGQCVTPVSSSAGAVQLASAQALALPSSTVSVGVRRVGGVAGDLTDGAYTTSGAGCASTAGGSFTFTGGATTALLDVAVSAVEGSTCVVTLTRFAPAAAGSPLSETITVSSSGGTGGGFGGGAGPGTFTVSASASAVAVGGAAVTFTVSRTGGAAATALGYTLSGALAPSGTLLAGAGPLTPGSPLAFADGQSSATVTFQPPAAAPASPSLPAAFTLSLAAPSGGALGSPSTASVTLSPPACPAPPGDLLEIQLGGVGNPTLQKQASRQVVAIDLPLVQPGYHSGTIAFGESAGGAYTPQPVLLEISVSRCKGVLDTAPSTPTTYCNLSSTNGTYNSITWFGQPYLTIDSATAASTRGYCWAPESEGPWYMNARWTYTACAFGASTCGFAIQQNLGPY